jgi:hypothetical protein
MENGNSTFAGGKLFFYISLICSINASDFSSCIIIFCNFNKDIKHYNRLTTKPNIAEPNPKHLMFTMVSK